MDSVLAAALIGAGGSLVGGLVGGWFALVAVRSQWNRERSAAKQDRSHQAAMSLFDWVGRTEEVLEAWSTDQGDVVALRTAFNAFSRTVTVQGTALTDDDLRKWVNDHVDLLLWIGEVAAQDPEASIALIKPAHRHADTVAAALEAHVRGDQVPRFQEVRVTARPQVPEEANS